MKYCIPKNFTYYELHVQPFIEAILFPNAYKIIAYDNLKLVTCQPFTNSLINHDNTEHE
jgi:hypothetical protein